MDDILLIENLFINEQIETKDGFNFEKGFGNVMVTTPHSVTQFRNGKFKTGEFRSGTVAKLLHQEDLCHIAYKTKNFNDDANYDDQCKFKYGIIPHILENNIEVLLDLHIASPTRPFDIDIGTGKGSNIGEAYSYLNTIKSTLSKKYNEIVVDYMFTASYPYTVSSFIHRITDIPCFQLEINWELVKDREELYKFLSLMREILKNLGELTCTVG